MLALTSSVVAVLTASATCYLFLKQLLRLTQDVQEPPALGTSIPFITPLIGMMREKNKYYVKLRELSHLPIYTLRLPGSRIYVINSPSLISAVQRQFKALAFPPIEVKTSINVCGTSKNANDILKNNLAEMEEDWSASNKFHKAMNRPLAPGSDLDRMNRIAINQITTTMEKLKKSRDESLALFAWVREQVTVATTESVYGPQNPFRAPEIHEAFWTFEGGVGALLMGVTPNLLAAKSVEARELVARGFERYFGNAGTEQGSGLIKARLKSQADQGMPLPDTAKFEAAGGIAILSNTVPATFWMLYHLFSDSVTLEECRTEILKHVSVSTRPDGTHVCNLDIARLKNDCPILLSTFKEVLRYHSIGASVRQVMEDHLLANQYLLKKGNLVMIPSQVQHTNFDIWGSDAGQFNHRRFVRDTSGKLPNPIAFRGFGGGTTLCPGRHFATTEILAFATMMMLQFDLAPVKGTWSQPTTKKAAYWAIVPNPDEDIEIKVSERDGHQDWNFTLTDSVISLALAAEDIADSEP